MTCTSCGRDSYDTYCRFCGEPLLAVCPKGHTSQPGSQFCGECSAPISVRPAAPSLAQGCAARALAWACTLAVLAAIGHALHAMSGATALWALSLFGITNADICNAFTVLVVVPAMVALISFLLPGAIGPAVRAALWWALSNAFRLIWAAARGIGRAAYLLAEGERPDREAGRRR